MELVVEACISGMGLLLVRSRCQRQRAKTKYLHDAHSPKCMPRLGFNFRFMIALRTLRSGRTTMTGTGECDRQYLLIESDKVGDYLRRDRNALRHTAHTKSAQCSSKHLHRPLPSRAHHQRVRSIQSYQSLYSFCDFPSNEFYNDRKLNKGRYLRKIRACKAGRSAPLPSDRDRTRCSAAEPV